MTTEDEQNGRLPNIVSSASSSARSTGYMGSERRWTGPENYDFTVGPYADLVPNADDFTAANEGDVTLGADTAEAGGSVSLTIPALDADENFSAFLFDSEGESVALAEDARYLDPSTLTIPASTELGDYRVGVYQPNGVVLGWDSLSVDAPFDGVVPNADDFTAANEGDLTITNAGDAAPGEDFTVGVDNATTGDAVVAYLFDEADQPRLLADVESYDGPIDATYPADLPSGTYKVGVYSSEDGSVLGWESVTIFDPAENPSEPLRYTVWPSADGVELGWQKPSVDGDAATGYYIEYVHHDGGVSEWTLFDTVEGADTTSYFATGLVLGEDYSFRVGPTTVNGNDDSVTYSRSEIAGFGTNCESPTQSNAVVSVTLTECVWDDYNIDFQASDLAAINMDTFYAEAPAEASDNVAAIDVTASMGVYGNPVDIENVFNADVESAWLLVDGEWISWDGLTINGDTVTGTITDGKFPDYVSTGTGQQTNRWLDYTLLVDFGADAEVPDGSYEPDVADFTPYNQYGVEVSQDGESVTEVEEGDTVTATVTSTHGEDAFDLYALSADGSMQKLIAEGVPASDPSGELTFYAGTAGDWVIASYTENGDPSGWAPLTVTENSDAPVDPNDPTDPVDPVDPKPTEPVDPSEDDLTSATEGKIQASPSTLEPGDRVTVKVAGGNEGDQVTAYIFSEPMLLGAYTLDANGQFVTAIPENLPTGVHSIAVYDADGEIIGWQTVTVVADVDAASGADGENGSASGDGSGSSEGNLAQTGASEFTGAMVFGAGALILVGFGLTGFAVAGRRQK